MPLDRPCADAALSARIAELEKRTAGLEDLVFALSIWLKSYAQPDDQPTGPHRVVPFSLTAKQRAILKSVLLPDDLA